ncbi:MAG TPA: 2-C-methyl-D-erythritol 4-phosphate cytidylyltransferase [Bacteroidia bacterium]|jgi:2-C-methyl-D-erythritol 4-phosphate cytidylyltransferase|nr:2-C-methyl-D-erythritol 4-phosphate cytidylyltransferase [Bacteroidia bacterium]HMU19824.1 2-C-methyl-D-erythritol 4-phosphate cytidylyltransferase [Bacteroidia bacterium]
MSLKRFAIIVAGGSGTRMQAGVPKQFLLLEGRPILMYSMECLYRAGSEITVVLSNGEHKHWQSLIEEHNFKVPHKIASGGTTRNRSVFNGLQTIDDNEALVAVHDAARPLLKLELVEKLFELALHRGNAIPVIPVRESLRRINSTENRAVNRAEIFAVQTPQVFKVDVLKEAFAKNSDTTFTDEASLIESIGFTVFSVQGDRDNIKITFPEDIHVASILLKKQLSI